MAYYHGTIPMDIYLVISKIRLECQRSLNTVADKFVYKLHGKLIRQKKNCYVALSRPTVKCEKTGSVFFFFFFFFLCQIWAKNLLKFVFNGLKKHLYMRFDCIPPEFSPFRNFKKNIGKLNSLTVRKKKKKKKIDRPTQFSDFGRVRATQQFFFFGLTLHSEVSTQ